MIVVFIFLLVEMYLVHVGSIGFSSITFYCQKVEKRSAPPVGADHVNTSGICCMSRLMSSAQKYIIFFGYARIFLYICSVIKICCIMKCVFDSYELHAIRVSLSREIEREKSFQENCPEDVTAFDRNYLLALESAYSKC